MQILKLWNIRLLESIPPTQQNFRDATSFTSSKNHSSKERRSFRTPKAAPIVKDDLKRAGSFSKMHTLGTGMIGAAAALPGRRSWGGSNEIYPPPIPSGSQLSQESMFNSLTSPPPLPPRPEESDSDEEDPDYAYIDENKVKGPENQRGRSKTLSSSGGGGRVSSPTLDDQLEELKKSIMRENKKKKRDKAAERKAATLHFPPSRNPRSRLPTDFVRAEPEDYLEPVASKRITSTSSEGVPKRDKDRLSPNVVENITRSLLDHGANANHSSSSSIGTTACEVFDDSQTPPDVHGGGGGVITGPGGNPPALPPRPWRNSSVTSTSSISSATSPSNVVMLPLTGSGATAMASGRPSVSEEKPIHEEVEERNVASPVLRSPKETETQVNTLNEQTLLTAAPVGNGRHVLGSKDGSSSPVDMGSPTASTSPPPPLPPRSPTRDRERLSRKSSSSSVSSNASSSRCPRCRSLKKSKTLVAKTTSLDQRGVPTIQPLSREDSRKSLPDLNSASPFPENNLAHNRQHQSHCVSREHHHSSSCSKCSVGSSSDGLPGGVGGGVGSAAAASNGSIPSSSSQNFEYLQLVSEESEKKKPQTNIDTDMSPALDLLSSCLQDLEYLENKVNQNAAQTSKMNSNSPNQSKNHQGATTLNHNEQRRMAVQTDIDAAVRQTELVRAELNMATGRSLHSMSSSAIMDDSRRSVANGHPPLLKKRNTITSFSSHSSSSSGSPSPSSTVPSSSSGPLHWTQQLQLQASRMQSHANGTVLHQTSPTSKVAIPPTGVASPRTLQSPTSIFPPGGSVGSSPTGPIGRAPPIPPRSLVSLGEPQPNSRPQPPHGHVMGRSFSQVNTSTRTHPQPQRSLTKSNSLGRHMSTWKSVYGAGGDHHTPQRTGSAIGMSSGMVGGPPQGGFQNHMDSQSATVFVHHLNRSNSRPRQLKAHLV